MIEIGGKPILWHIMKGYSHYGVHDFIICCGYKQHVIKEWFADYYLHNSDVTFDFTRSNEMTVHNNVAEPWRVTLVDTGLNTMTGGRVKRVQPYIGEEPFFLTYGDGVADIDIPALLAFHKSHGKIATITTTQPAGRFGAIKIDEDGSIVSFTEKARRDQSWVNIGFMVLNRKVFDYLGDGTEMLERTPFERLAADHQMAAYKHPGFWSPMDTVHDRAYLEELWGSGKAPWKTWDV